MKFLFTTLAIGEKYFNSAKQFSLDLHNQNIDFFRIIVSDISDDSIPNTIVCPITSDTTTFFCNSFNYNLKYLAFQHAIENINSSYDYIIYIDADWRLRTSYSNQKIIHFLESYDKNIDIFFERPHLIGAAKHDDWGCFWKHKIAPYNLLNTSNYDHTHVPNEQFLIVKNNHKLLDFIKYWSDRNLFCVNNNIWTFAEGVEIGMSYTDANMNAQWTNFSYINDCFEFNDTSGNLHIRF